MSVENAKHGEMASEFAASRSIGVLSPCCPRVGSSNCAAAMNVTQISHERGFIRKHQINRSDEELAARELIGARSVHVTASTARIVFELQEALRVRAQS